MFAENALPGAITCPGDTCKTPPFAVPVPYLNIALIPTGMPVVPNLMMVGAPAHTAATMLMPTNGDQVGTMGGVVSSMIMGMQQTLVHPSSVLFGSMPPRVSGRSLGMTNMSNITSPPPMPNQTKVSILAK